MDKPFLKNKLVTVLLHTLPGPVRRLDVLLRYRNFLLIIVMDDTLELVKRYQNGGNVMRKIILVIMALLLAGYLCACAPQGTHPGEENTAPVTLTEETVSQIKQIQPETTAEGQWEDTPARKAFQKVLQTIHDELYWPELPDVGEIDLWEPGTIEDEEFAVFDVDGDGQEELLVSVSNTYTAGMYEIIYGYDAQTDGVQVEAQNYWAVTHYPGMLKVDASHNHGYAGDILWPYTLQFYQEAKDAYEDAFYVDAWCKAITDYDPYKEMPYPEDIDTDHDGYVYLITENGEERILDRADYQKWEAELFTGKEPLTIPWQKLTAENIGLEVRKVEDIARWGQDELLHEADFELCAGKPGKMRLYGKQLNEYFFGASDAVVELEDGHAIPVDIQDGLMRWWGQTGIHYTESYDQTCGLILEDVNFDCYTDIGLQVSVTAYNAPYLYWYYDPDADAYCFLNGFCCPLEVNPETERCTEEYHEGQTYYKVIYRVQDRHMVVEERWITEYVDGQPVTRKDDHAE